MVKRPRLYALLEGEKGEVGGDRWAFYSGDDQADKCEWPCIFRRFLNERCSRRESQDRYGSQRRKEWFQTVSGMMFHNCSETEQDRNQPVSGLSDGNYFTNVHGEVQLWGIEDRKVTDVGQNLSPSRGYKKRAESKKWPLINLEVVPGKTCSDVSTAWGKDR